MTDRIKQKRDKRQLRHRRVRAKVSGSQQQPRLAVFKSAQHIYAQIIDDTKGVTLASASDLDIEKGTKTEKAVEVGKRIAQKAKEAKISKVSYDRGGFKYHGRIKAVAEAARENGLEF